MRRMRRLVGLRHRLRRRLLYIVGRLPLLLGTGPARRRDRNCAERQTSRRALSRERSERGERGAARACPLWLGACPRAHPQRRPVALTHCRERLRKYWSWRPEHIPPTDEMHQQARLEGLEPDLLELDGEDLRRAPIELRKATLKGLLRRTHAGVAPAVLPCSPAVV